MLEQDKPFVSSYEVSKPDIPPRAFYVVRHRDISGENTGVTRTGYVAQGTQFDDGSCAVRWGGKTPCTQVWGSISDFLVVHGHDGETSIEWVDSDPGAEWLERLAVTEGAGGIDRSAVL